MVDAGAAPRIVLIGNSKGASDALDVMLRRRDSRAG